MSLRPRANCQSPLEKVAPDAHPGRLSHVLSVGVKNDATPKVRDMRSYSKTIAPPPTIDPPSKEDVEDNLDTLFGAAQLTTDEYKTLASELKRRWQGATKYMHWATANPGDITKVLKANYRKSFTDQAWKNIVNAKNASRWFYAETGANCHAAIYVTDNTGDGSAYARVRVFVSIVDERKPENELSAVETQLKKIVKDIFGEEEQSWGAGITEQMPFSQIQTNIDQMITSAVNKMYAKWEDVKARAEEEAQTEDGTAM